MLQTKTVEPGTLSLLKELMALPQLKQYTLVGGTALALRYGHRLSVDLDLFTNEPIDFELLTKALEQTFNTAYVYEKSFLNVGHFCFIRNVKVDFVYYPHQIIQPIQIIDNIRLYGDKDITAMKVQAILGRGKKKDFWDMAELLQHYNVKEILDWHKEKFPNKMLAISIPNALTYFNDADESEDPISLKGQTWESVKKFIQLQVREFLS